MGVRLTWNILNIRRLENAITRDWRLCRWAINESLNEQKAGLPSVLPDEMKNCAAAAYGRTFFSGRVLNIQRRNLSSGRDDYLTADQIHSQIFSVYCAQWLYRET